MHKQSARFQSRHSSVCGRLLIDWSPEAVDDWAPASHQLPLPHICRYNPQRHPRPTVNWRKEKSKEEKRDRLSAHWRRDPWSAVAAHSDSTLLICRDSGRLHLRPSDHPREIASSSRIVNLHSDSYLAFSLHLQARLTPSLCLPHQQLSGVFLY